MEKTNKIYDSQLTKSELIEKYGEHAQTSEKFGYMMFFVGQNIAFGVMLSALNMFWLSIGITQLTIGTIMLVARIWDAVNDPMLGFVVQKTNIKKLGKFKPWAFATSFLLPFIVMLTFVNVNPDFASTGEAGKGVIFYAAITYILYGTIYTLCDIPALSLSTAMEPDTKKRTQLVIIFRVGAAIAGIFTSLLFFGIQGAVGGAWGYTVAGIVMGILMLFSMTLIILVKERNVDRSENSTENTVKLKEVGSFIKGNKHLVKLLVIKTILSFTLAFATVSLFTFMTGSNGIPDSSGGWIIEPNGFFSDSGAQSLTVIMTSASIAGLILALSFSPVVKRVGKRKSAMIFSTIGFSTILVGTVLFTTVINSIWIYSIINIGIQIVFLSNINLNFMYVPETVEYGHYKTGIRQVAIASSASSFMTKFDMAISGFVPGVVITALGIGVDFGAYPIEQVQILFWITIATTTISAVLVFVLWGIWWNLDREDVVKMSILNSEGKHDNELDAKLGILRNKEKPGTKTPVEKEKIKNEK